MNPRQLQAAWFGKTASYPNKDSREGLKLNKMHKDLLIKMFTDAINEHMLAYDIAREHDDAGFFAADRTAEETIRRIAKMVLRSRDHKTHEQILEAAYELSSEEGWHHYDDFDHYETVRGRRYEQ